MESSIVFLSERKSFEPAAANAGLCYRWRTGTDRIEEKCSLLKTYEQHLDSSFWQAETNRNKRSDRTYFIAHQMLTPISNLKFMVNTSPNHENQRR